MSERNLKTIMSIALSYFKKKSQNFTKISYQYVMCKYSKRGFIQMNWSMSLSTGERKLELFIAYCYNIFVVWSWESHYMCLILSQERKCMRVAKTQAWFSEGWGHSLKIPARRKSEWLSLDHARIRLQKYGLISGCPSSIHPHTAPFIREFDPTAWVLFLSWCSLSTWGVFLLCWQAWRTESMGWRNCKIQVIFCGDIEGIVYSRDIVDIGYCSD